MGVPLQSLIPTSTIPLDQLHGTTLAIDGPNQLMQLLHNPYQRQTHQIYLNRVGKPIMHLYGWLQKIRYWTKYQISPVVVFDGKPDARKYPDAIDRARTIQGLQKKYDRAVALGDRKLAQTYALSPPLMWHNCITESKTLLQAAGIPVITAPSEAEAQCAQLQKAGLVQYVLSMDFDVLLFGAIKTLRKMTFVTRQKVGGKWRNLPAVCERLELPTILKTLGISYFQLIDLGILLGNDYFPGIPGLGPKRSLEAVRYYGSIDRMIESHPTLGKKLVPSTLADLRLLFMTPVVQEYVRLPPPPSRDIEFIKHFLIHDHFLKPEKILKIISKLVYPYRHSR
jgi:flap endonuclease-1